MRALVIAVGLCWSVAYVAIALACELALYADGAMFSYAIAVQDVWAFHWHNISGRLTVYFLSLLPAELHVGLSGSPGAGIVVYALLFYVAPLAGLIGTFAADRSRDRIIFVYACLSTALLCPLVFGFPTEMCGEADPALGNPHFVSSERIASNVNRLSWFSTTPYLSAIVAHFMPNRLVIDPTGNYFWLSCATATANANAVRAAPAESRNLVRVYSCPHRP